ncbi:efflux RND transporter periplasmic adaptor subunit [Emticicia sp. ODNR4P]|nr:efflux RND transporter periplasmic adaptor subunit [Emticicia sp. ODNR4P]
MNQKIKYIVGALLLTFVLSNCKNSDKTATATKEEAKPETEATVKEVELNEAQFKNSDITLGTYELKNLSEVINTNGYTKLPPQNQADVSVFIGGIVKTINVIEGQFVKKGQSLATIQSLAFNNLRLEKEKLQAELQTAKVNKDYLELEYARQKELSDENVNAKKVFQKVSSDLELEKKKIETFQKQITIIGQTLQMGGSSETPILAIPAPISGYITSVNIKIGSNAEVGTPLFSIVDNSKMYVYLLVYEKDLNKVKVGQNVRFILTNQNNVEIKGKIFSIEKSFANESKSIAVHVDIVNEKQTLISGMYVNALIDVGANTVQALPTDAIVKADGREFMFVLEEGHEEKKQEDKEVDKTEQSEGKTYHFQRIEVKTGNGQLGFVQVTPLQAIEKNAKIVTKGAYYIQSHLLKSEGGGGHED